MAVLGLAPRRLAADDGRVSTPSRGDRHTARLARLRRLRWLTVGGLVLVNLGGLVLMLWAEDRPLRIVGLFVVVISIVQALSLPAVFRAGRPIYRRRS